MIKSKRVLWHLSVIVTLLLAGGALLLASGMAVSITISVMIAIAAILWLFTRKPKPENEPLSNAVSCCHYLGERGEGLNNQSSKSDE